MFTITLVPAFGYHQKGKIKDNAMFEGCILLNEKSELVCLHANGYRRPAFPYAFLCKPHIRFVRIIADKFPVSLQGTDSGGTTAHKRVKNDVAGKRIKLNKPVR